MDEAARRELDTRQALDFEAVEVIEDLSPEALAVLGELLEETERGERRKLTRLRQELREEIARRSEEVERE